MRRIAIALILVAIIAGMYACSADAPTAPRGGGGGTSSSALTVVLFTSNANPPAGTCTLIEAIVSLNGSPVPDGTSVAFSTDFGSFSQNGLPLVSVVTTGGTAVTALCGPAAGTAHVKGTSTVSGKTGTGTLTINFQPSSSTGPFVASCSPSFGPKEGGTTLTLSGGRFFGSVSTTRVQFTANGITRDAIVSSVSANQIVVQTPAFPELNAPTTPTSISLTLGTNLPTPTVLSLPNCFAFGTAGTGTPTITAILPASGTNEGNTRVTIVGSGFPTTGAQVFFGSVEATVVSVTFNQIVVLSPPAFGAGQGNLNQPVQVTVKNIASGAVSNGVTFTYTPALRLTSVSPSEVPSNGPFPQVTIFGQGFQAPVAVVLAGRPAQIVSVSATEVIVVPTGVLVTDCTDVSGPVSVTNVNSGDSASGLSFLYLVKTFAPALTFSEPASGDVSAGTVTVTLHGVNLSHVTKVTFGGRAAAFSIVDDFTITATVPNDFATPPQCPTGVPAGTETKVEDVDIVVTSQTGCTSTLAKGFTYFLPCTVPPTPTP